MCHILLPFSVFFSLLCLNLYWHNGIWEIFIVVRVLYTTNVDNHNNFSNDIHVLLQSPSKILYNTLQYTMCSLRL